LLFESAGTGTNLVISGILNGTAPVSIPAGCGMFMGGGNLAGTITCAAPLDLSFDSTVSGSLTLLDTSVTGAAPLIVTGKLTIAGTGTTSVAGPLVLNHPDDRVIEIAPGSEFENSGAITFQAGEAMVRGTWRHNQIELIAQAATTIAGDGVLTGGQVFAEGLIKPGPDSGYGDLQIDTYLGASEGSVIEIEVGGSGVGQFDRLVLRSMAVYGALKVDFSRLPVAEVGAYPFVFSTGTATLDFSFVSLVGLDGSRVFNHDPATPSQFTISPSTRSYEYWAAAMGLTAGVNDGLSDIAVPGGKPNILHFAFDTDPFGNGSAEGKRRTRSVDVGGTRHVAITLPVLVGAVFAGSPSPAATVDGLSYMIQGSGDLQTWLLSI
jgi:hypothetical protein